MVYKNTRIKKHGLTLLRQRLRRVKVASPAFTLVEMLIIAPIVILVIGVFISAIINMTGAVLTSRGANALAYSINDALTRIDQDVKASGGFLATNSNTVLPIQNGQGLNDDTTAFKNASSSSATDPKLIINSYATDQNPLTPTRNLIDITNSPFSCSSPYVTQNSQIMTNIVYFVKAGTLWRRVIMPANYATAGCNGIQPWQKPTCTPGYNSGTYPFCGANDQRLVDGVTAITITYWDSQKPPVQINNASDFNVLDANRQIAMQTAGSVKVDITAAKNLSGRTVTQSGSIRSLGIQAPTMLTQPANQTVTAGTVTFTTAANGTNMTIKWEQSTDSGITWTTVSGQTTSILTFSASGTQDGNMYHAIYTNSYGQVTSSPALLSVNTSGWTPLTFQNSWGNYAGYNTGGYMKTSSGVVLLKGLIARTGTPAASETIAVLPPAYRPSAPLLFGTSTGSNVSGCLYVMTDGSILFCSGSGSWMSLENIHFIADTSRYNSKPVNIFMNGWSNYGGGWGQASYVVDSIGRVNIQGLLTPGTRGDNVGIFDLPSNLRPSNYMHVPEYGVGFAAMGIGVGLGAPAINDKSLGSGFLTINAMYYPAGVGSWSDLSFQNGWSFYGGGFSTPQYTKAADGLVSLKGLIKNGTMTAGLPIATLPSGFRPAGRILFASYATNAYARVDIDPSGQIQYEAGSNAYLSLDGLTFYADGS